KKKADDFPKDSIGIVELGKEEVWKAPRVRSYKTAAKGTGWVAYQLEKTIEPVAPPRTRSNEPALNKRIDSLNRVLDSMSFVIKNLESTPPPVDKKEKKKKNKDEEEEWDPTGGLATNELPMDADDDESSGASSETGTDLVLKKLPGGE